MLSKAVSQETFLIKKGNKKVLVNIFFTIEKNSPPVLLKISTASGCLSNPVLSLAVPLF